MVSDILFCLFPLFRPRELLTLHLYIHLQRTRAGACVDSCACDCLVVLNSLGLSDPSLESPASFEMAVIPICLHVVSICALGTTVSSSGAHSQNGNKKERTILACPFCVRISLSVRGCIGVELHLGVLLAC